MKILIVGLGSIGKLHLRNLKLLGYEPDTCEPNGNHTYKEMYDVSDTMYDLVIICTPTEHHVEAIHYFNDRRYPYLMVEKPLYKYPSATQEFMELEMGEFVTMKHLHSKIFINHAYRFDPGLQKLKECLWMVGDKRHAVMENSYSFEKLHPNYKMSEYSGVLWDDSHLSNTSRYLFGDPKEILFRSIKKKIAQFAWVTEDGMIVSHSTDVFNERYKKRIEVRGSEGTLIWNFRAHELFFAPKDESERVAISYKKRCHLTEALKYVLKTVEEGGNFEINNLDDAIKDMEVLETLCKKS